jgi:hypothetical protein
MVAEKKHEKAKVAKLVIDEKPMAAKCRKVVELVITAPAEKEAPIDWSRRVVDDANLFGRADPPPSMHGCAGLEIGCRRIALAESPMLGVESVKRRVSMVSG